MLEKCGIWECLTYVGGKCKKIVNLCKYEKYPPIVCLQQQYNLLCRHPDFEEFQVCKMEGLGVLPWSPLKGGMLAGKYKRGSRPKPSTGRIGMVAQDESKAIEVAPAWSQYDKNEDFWKLVKGMERIAKENGKTIPQVAIRWLLQKDVVPCVVIGANSLQQLEDNVGAAINWKLSEEQMEELDTLSNPGLPYPYEMIRRLNAQSVNSFIPKPDVKNSL